MIRASSFAMLVAAAVLLAGCDREPLAPVRNEEPATPVEPGTPLATSNMWFNDDKTIQYDRPDWMGELPDTLRLSELSIPGTHETMSRSGFWAQTQSLTLERQLQAGIRAFDIRLRNVGDSLKVFHGTIDENATFGTDVLAVFKKFLAEHRRETVIMRVQKTAADVNAARTFADAVAWYKAQYDSIIWKGDPRTHFEKAPRLGDVRGKIVILQDFMPADSADSAKVGIPWTSLNIQDNFNVYLTYASFNDKWSAIRAQIDSAMTPDTAWYVNFTSGSDPLLVARPVVVAFGALIFFENCDGMNVRTYRYLTSCYGDHCPSHVLDEGEHGRVGMIMSDFPGPGLIDAVIAENGLPRVLANDPPLAVAGGPYVANEGTPIVFDASASSDPEHDPLRYRWDVDGDSVYDTPWSSDPTATHTWFDEYQGIAQVEVTDSGPSRAVNAVADVTVLNVAPDVAIDSVSTTVPGYLLTGDTAEMHGSFTDPGYLDTHTALWRFGDQATLTGTLVETNEPPEGRGTVTDPHVNGAPGLYDVELNVLDDDGGLGADTTQVHVLSAAEALQFIDGYIQALPDAAFRGPADNRKRALSNELAAVRTMISEGNLNGALNKLRHDIRAKFDGFVDGKPQDDWIVDPASQQQLCLMLDELVSYMEGPYWNSA